MRYIALALATAALLAGVQLALAQQPTQTDTLTCYPTDYGPLCISAPEGLTPTVVARPSSTPLPAPATVAPTIVPSVVPTAAPTPVPTAVPTVPPAARSLEYGSWVPTQGDTCTQEIHNRSFVEVNGKRYSTWHPPVDPVTGCTFGHEHGMDPRQSRADNTLPAFGLAAEADDMVEGHVGYKVDWVNQGDLTATAEGGNLPSPFSSRTVVHMGTGGTARFVTQFHSLELDAVWPNGHFVHINLLADTGPSYLSGNANPAGCDLATRLRYFATPDDPQGLARRGAKDFSTVGCRDFYEIWNGATVAIVADGQFREPNSAIWFAAPAFDTPLPGLTWDPSDSTKVVHSLDYWRTWEDPYYLAPYDGVVAGTAADRFKGCGHGVYHGPHYIRNFSGWTDYWTDAYGNVVASGDAPGRIHQQISQGQYITESGGVVQAQAKTATETCAASVHLPN